MTLAHAVTLAQAVTVTLAGLAAAPVARAQEPPVGPPPEAVVKAPAAEAPMAEASAAEASAAEASAADAPPVQQTPRPRLSLAIGMGATFDPTGFSDGAHALPAFFAVGGFGDGLAGVDLGAFSSSASGRYASADSVPVDRLALDAFGVIRPAARIHRDDPRYGYRVLHTVAVELGLGLERDGRTMVAGSRFEVHTGARVELPLTRAGLPSELRLRLAVRRAIGLYTPEVAVAKGSSQATAVGDSTELYAALAVVF